MEEAFARLARTKERFALFCFDLNNFKAVNDSLGHAAGDELLTQAAERLRTCARTGDTLARLGGDEFGLVAAGIHDASGASALAHRLLSAFEKPFRIDGVEVPCTVSIGIAVAPSDGDNPRALLRNADIGLYRAKGARGGAFQFFEPRHDAEARKRRALELDLRNALQRGELHLAYQPILSLPSGRVVGCEALLRWHHPSRGLVPPADFISLAEATGLIRPLGEWVLREACRCKLAARRSPRRELFASPV